MSRRSLVLAVVAGSALLASAGARAEPWYAGRAGHRRVVHLGAAALGGVLYISSETFLKPTLAPSSCRWCEPTSYDVSVRSALKWNDTGAALTLSNLDGFVVAPISGLGILMLASAGDGEASTARWLDDTIPVIESGVFAGLLNQLVKFTVAEQRPFVHFGDPARPHDLDDDVSFYSGHTTLAFAIATSAGMVAHERGYRLEPAVWTAAYAIAVSTGYLRIASDRHYLTDVVTGALTGTAIGLAVPLLLHHHVLSGHRIEVTPAPNGITVLGMF